MMTIIHIIFVSLEVNRAWMASTNAQMNKTSGTMVNKKPKIPKEKKVSIF
ncbi:hypothetical protein [Echinicola salinicaeni]|nr:hypothetical protein [Echinicola salinicaeni]